MVHLLGICFALTRRCTVDTQLGHISNPQRRDNWNSKWTLLARGSNSQNGWNNQRVFLHEASKIIFLLLGENLIPHVSIDMNTVSRYSESRSSVFSAQFFKSLDLLIFLWITKHNQSSFLCTCSQDDHYNSPKKQYSWGWVRIAIWGEIHCNITTATLTSQTLSKFTVLLLFCRSVLGISTPTGSKPHPAPKSQTTPSLLNTNRNSKLCANVN